MYRRFKLAVILLAVLTSLGLLTSGVLCSESPGPKEIKIGVIYPLSGGLAATGKTMKEGVELAADIINNKYPELGIPIAEWEGIPSLGGAKIKLIFADHRADPGLGADLAKRLIEDEKVVGILGCYNSSVTKTVSAVAERYKIPFLNGTSSFPGLRPEALSGSGEPARTIPSLPKIYLTSWMAWLKVRLVVSEQFPKKR